MMENKDLSAKVMEWWLFKKMVVWIFFFVKKKKKLFLLSWFVDGGWGSDVPWIMLREREKGEKP